MKKLMFLVFATMACSAVAQVQDFPVKELLAGNPDMMRYVEGLRAIRMGDMTDSTHYYKAAYDLLNENPAPGTTPLMKQELNVMPVLEDDVVENDMPRLSRDYAAFKWLNVYAPTGSMMRGGNKCKVKLITLKPHGTSCYVSNEEDHDITTLAVAQWGATVQLCVITDESTIIGTAYDDGGISFTRWNGTGRVKYKITNTSDTTANIALVSDH